MRRARGFSWMQCIADARRSFSSISSARATSVAGLTALAVRFVPESLIPKLAPA